MISGSLILLQVPGVQVCYEVQAEQLDLDYLNHWVQELDLLEQWQTLIERP
jgi:hypothetical protein